MFASAKFPSIPIKPSAGANARGAFPRSEPLPGARPAKCWQYPDSLATLRCADRCALTLSAGPDAFARQARAATPNFSSSSPASVSPRSAVSASTNAILDRISSRAADEPLSTASSSSVASLRETLSGSSASIFSEEPGSGELLSSKPDGADAGNGFRGADPPDCGGAISFIESP